MSPRMERDFAISFAASPNYHEVAMGLACLSIEVAFAVLSYRHATILYTPPNTSYVKMTRRFQDVTR